MKAVVVREVQAKALQAKSGPQRKSRQRGAVHTQLLRQEADRRLIHCIARTAH